MRFHRKKIKASPERGPWLLLLTALLAPGCGGSSGGAGSAPAPLFEEAPLDASRIETHWPDGHYRIPELSAGGLALFDADGDGDLDILQVRAPAPDRPGDPAPDRLLRQEEGFRFAEAPGASGLDDPGYGNGAAVGDVEGDGDLDVYICNLGPDSLYTNDGRGAFRRSEAAGIAESEWSASAAFLDHDRDGDLDLYVARYLRDDPDRVCRPSADAPRDYCGPGRYQPVPDLLYRNRGDGSFEDVSRAAGIVEERPGFGVVCADLDGDGWVDIYVANDMQPNSLYLNRRDGTFRESGLEMGAALSGEGKAKAGMGVAAGDVDGDGRLDLFVTNLVEQTNTLFVAAPRAGSAPAGFADRSASAGLGAPSFRSTGWGCGFQDLDGDGDVDLAVVNGRVARGPLHPRAAMGAFWTPYAEPNTLYLKEGDRFVEARAAGGDFTARAEKTHALAFGDLDRDGDVDLVTAGLGNRLRVFRNTASASGRRWLQVRALTGKRDALGALVTVAAGGRRQARPVISAYSFQSASEAVAHFGLGEARAVDLLEVLWPDGRRERFPPPPVDRLVVLRQGEGTPAEAGRR